MNDKASNQGGARPGAGRPKGRRSKHNRELAKVIDKTMPIEDRVKKLADIAKGEDKGLALSAIRELNDREFGKAAQGVVAVDPKNGKKKPYALAFIPAMLPVGTDRDGEK
jgi:hypothetical protein